MKMNVSDRVKKQWACQLCGVSPYRKGEEKTKLVMDHDHGISPPRARGRLCHRCNLGLGVIESMMDRNMLDMAVGYVTSHGWEKPSIWTDERLWSEACK